MVRWLLNNGGVHLSLCVSFYLNGNIYVFADTRVSAYKNGRSYYVHDNYNKLRQVGDKVVFTSGELDICDNLFAAINERSTVEDIAEAARKAYNDFKRANPDYDVGKFGIEFGAYVHAIEDGVPVYYQLRYIDDFKVERHVPNNQELFAVAARSEEALAHIAKLAGRNIPIDTAIMRTYERLANEVIGGKLVRYTIMPNAIERLVRPIRDGKPLRMWPIKGASLHADMQGNVVARKITLTGTIENSSINTSTITAAVINGGQINGAQITGGSITSNTDIDITRDIRVGNNIYLGLTGQTNDRRIEFVDSGPYRSYIGFTNATKQLEVYAANDIRINSGLNVSLNAAYDVYVNANRVIIPFNAYLGTASSSNRLVMQADLGGKANVADAGYNLTFDTNTRNLKMYNRYGDLMAQVHIP